MEELFIVKVGGNIIDDDEKLPYDFGCEMSGAQLRSVRNLISIKCRLEVKYLAQRRGLQVDWIRGPLQLSSIKII